MWDLSKQEENMNKTMAAILISMSLFAGTFSTSFVSFEAERSDQFQRLWDTSLLSTQQSKQAGIEDVYEALLEAKNDKIVVISNFVTWVLSIAGILITIIAASFGWITISINRKLKKANELIQKLEDRERELKIKQDEMNQVLNSIDFEKYSSRIAKFEKVIREESEKQNSKPTSKEAMFFNDLMDPNLGEEIHERLENIETNFNIFERNSLIDELDNTRDRAIYEKVKAHIDKRARRKLIKTVDPSELRELDKLMNALLQKYLSD